MNAPADGFSSSYAEARAKFRAAAEAAGLDVEAHVHPLRGRDGEELAMDVVRDGPRHAERLLIVSSGCHGVEGYCGSGAQVALLRDRSWRFRATVVEEFLLHATRWMRSPARHYPLREEIEQPLRAAGWEVERRG